jgi:hypothetical protein
MMAAECGSSSCAGCGATLWATVMCASERGSFATAAQQEGRPAIAQGGHPALSALVARMFGCRASRRSTSRRALLVWVGPTQAAPRDQMLLNQVCILLGSLNQSVLLCAAIAMRPLDVPPFHHDMRSTRATAAPSLGWSGA